MIHPVGDRLADGDGHAGDQRQASRIAEDRLHPARSAREPDLDLGGIHLLGVLVEFRAAGAARGPYHSGLLDKRLFERAAEGVRLRERGAREGTAQMVRLPSLKAGRKV